MEFFSAFGATPRGTSRHFDFSFIPINFQIMFPKPRMSKYQFLFAQAGDTEDGMFRMIFVSEDETDSFGDRTRLIGSAIYIVDRNWRG